MVETDETYPLSGQAKRDEVCLPIASGFTCGFLYGRFLRSLAGPR
jgi:hypothetical protein